MTTTPARPLLSGHLVRTCLLGLLAAASVSCASHFGELHYFKSENARGEAMNYYRLRVSGKTAMASSRYVSGYFDEAAVDAYFSEIAQPAKGEFKATPQDGQTPAQPLDKSLAGKRLVLILSSNSDAIATQIGNFAENNETMATLARLINRDELQAAERADQELARRRVGGAALAALGDSVTSSLKEDSTEEEFRTALLQYVNALAKELGRPTSFRTLAEAKTWFDSNRTSLEAGR